MNDKNMIQTALWLPRDMHERLKKEGGERGLGEAIRRRIQASFGVETTMKAHIERWLWRWASLIVWGTYFTLLMLFGLGMAHLLLAR